MPPSIFDLLSIIKTAPQRLSPHLAKEQEPVSTQPVGGYAKSPTKYAAAFIGWLRIKGAEAVEDAIKAQKSHNSILSNLKIVPKCKPGSNCNCKDCHK